MRKPAEPNGDAPPLNLTRTNTSSLAALTLLAAVGLLFAACGASDPEVSSTEATDSMESDVNSSAVSEAEEAMSAAVATEPDVEEGSDVGQRVPAFYIRDASATKITSEELFAKGRPSFFYFFTTW